MLKSSKLSELSQVKINFTEIYLVVDFIIFFTLKKTVGIRVSEREELEGLDAHEHGMDAYPDFRLNEH